MGTNSNTDLHLQEARYQHSKAMELLNLAAQHMHEASQALDRTQSVLDMSPQQLITGVRHGN